MHPLASQHPTTLPPHHGLTLLIKTNALFPYHFSEQFLHTPSPGGAAVSLTSLHIYYLTPPPVLQFTRQKTKSGSYQNSRYCCYLIIIYTFIYINYDYEEGLAIT